MHQCLILLLLLRSIFYAEAVHTLAPKKTPSERLVPIGSTTALECEPYTLANATWHRDGHVITTVEGHKNAVLEGRRPRGGERIPEIGFLVIYDVRKEDEGRYYCQRANDTKWGEVFQLKVAYVDEIDPGQKITINPEVPILGRPLVLKCPIPSAYPPPKVTWTVNSLPISHISSDYHATSNGTLTIAHFSYHHFGFFECHVNNFAGHASANTFIDSRELTASIESLKPSFAAGCSAALRSSLFMFLLGCLVTSAAVLIYLICAVCLLKPGRPRRVLRPTFWSRTDPRLAPGFRKAVVPLPDCFVNARMLPPSS
uniref:Ig-like domain-containing protein n=1 Tax=Caenorhabditis japonica TaxID=281687 RepID=A0A8R1EHC4_CAEJA